MSNVRGETHYVRLKFKDQTTCDRAKKLSEAQREKIVIRAIEEKGDHISTRKIFHLPDGFKLQVHNETDVDKILSVDCRQRLSKVGLEPFISPEKIARQTVVLYTRSAIIHEATNEEIKNYIISKDEQLQIQDIWKGKEMGVVKIQFKNSEQAKKVKENGLKLMGFHLNSFDMDYGEYIPILQCLRCYELETHASRQCRIAYDLCGDCSQRGHRYDVCDSPVHKCINCIKAGKPHEETLHKARSNTCPLKKEILRNKRQERKNAEWEEENPVTYEDAPLPETNAWGRQRSTSRGGGRGRSRGGGRGRSRGRGGSRGGSRSASTQNRTQPKPTPKPPNNSTKTFPGLARNAKQRPENARGRPQPSPIVETSNVWEESGVMEVDSQTEDANTRGVSASRGGDPWAGHVHPESGAVSKNSKKQRNKQNKQNNQNKQGAESGAATTITVNNSASMDSIRINVILNASHQHNVTRPGQFNRRANELFERNSIPPVDLGDDLEWNSLEYLTTVSNATCNTVQPNSTAQLHNAPRQMRDSSTDMGQFTEHLKVHLMEKNPEICPTSPDIIEAALEPLDDEDMDHTSQNVKRTRDEAASPTSDPAAETMTNKKKAKSTKEEEEKGQKKTAEGSKQQNKEDNNVEDVNALMPPPTSSTVLTQTPTTQPKSRKHSRSRSRSHNKDRPRSSSVNSEADLARLESNMTPRRVEATPPPTPFSSPSVAVSPITSPPYHSPSAPDRRTENSTATTDGTLQVSTITHQGSPALSNASAAEHRSRTRYRNPGKESVASSQEDLSFQMDCLSEAGQEAAAGEICRATVICCFTDDVIRAHYMKKQCDKRLTMQDILNLKSKKEISTIISAQTVYRGDLPERLVQEKTDTLMRVFEENWIEEHQWDKFLLGPIDESRVKLKHVAIKTLEDVDIAVRSSVSRDRKRRPTKQDVETFLRDSEVFSVKLDHDRDVFVPTQPTQPSQTPQDKTQDFTQQVKSPQYIDV